MDAGSFFSGVEGGGGHRARLDLLGGMVCVECSNETPLTTPACFPFHRGQPSRLVTSCYVVLRCVASTPVHDGLNLHRDCRGKFLNSLKIWHGVHGNGGVSRSPETVPRRCVTSSRFAVVRLKPGYRGCRGPSVNLA